MSGACNAFLGVVFVAGLLAPATADAGSVEDDVGRTFTYRCTGAHYKETVFRISAVENGEIRVEGTKDSKAFTMEKPVAVTGTSLISRMNNNDEFGLQTMRIDPDDFPDFAQYRPGAQYKADVAGSNRQGNYTWTYEISVGDPKQVDHPVLGPVELVEVKEKRAIWRGQYRSAATFRVDPSVPRTVSWTYTDHRGTQECDLAGLD